ncbi:hypothetical protein GLOTRDRAFT_105517 [Gloeophyllum trabeum ATCC 11539]|uniref:ATP-grasp domain-containing protein n=1 Tax=Gloeophyllum trabeum (strain ATCC 11539 / FP-39264 / Madison 617) TaxID=670483 RepID=S7QBF9_GLOTA|nr:uncharacterized protein GLOTRDRAFT_105517 [Gloeophyllum trabeum ATCC 11539]EPQ56693.1 hypothetical protein GLOTRDRAFT_105517 [Gloeophyllum trabeum ATCC 11539]
MNAPQCQKISNPTRRQTVITSLLLIVLSLLTAPATSIVVLFFLIHSQLKGTALHLQKCRVGRKTVLVTGGRTNKCLVLLRAFKREGYRVLVAEEGSWGAIACTRFSRATDGYYALPEPSNETDRLAYKRAIADIVARERVDVWVPCSSIFATVEDAEAALEISSAAHHHCDTFIQHPDLVDSLHWKDRFMRLCLELDFQVPESQLITSSAEGVEFLFSAATRKKGYSYILKCVELDDAGRSDLTLLPLETKEATIAHFARMPVPPSDKIPFVLQRFIRGPEYCTHGVVRNGQLRAFVASRSSDMVLRYLDLESYAKSITALPRPFIMDGLKDAALDRATTGIRREREVGKQAEHWTVQFLERWSKLLREQGKTGKQAELTGHFSFDFLLEESEGQLYPIECNPRTHTAVALLSETPRLASAYVENEGLDAGPVRPADGVPHGPLTMVSRHIAGLEKDVSFDASDPLPFFILAHVQIPWIIVRLLWKGKGWSRINTSTARVYEC